MSNKTYNNPWAGLSSYQDPEGSDVQLKFCGRDNESFDVMRLIDDNIFVTLYGKSGTGKTSLLNAGVFPRLRREQYLPVSIRLGMDAIDMSFQQCILTKLDKTLDGKGHKETIDVVPMPDDEQSPAYLWSYFARTRFVANDDSTLFPVVVFDQFEEVFRHRRQDAEALLRQIYFMMDENHALSDRMVDGQPYQYDFNFRFVASIREDDLYRLEDSIDNCYLPDMKRCRYRLRSLSEQGARDAVLIPGEGLFRPEEEEGIVRTIMEIARNKDDDSISTNILSLICSRIFVDCQKSGAEFITPALVDTFVKGNPFEQFYNEATRGFSNREKNYIEDHLVDSTGRRNSVPEADFLLHVKKGVVLLEGTQKILQRTSVSSDGSNYRIELIHDSFCEPLEGQRQKRLQRKRVKQITTISVLALLFIVVAVAIISSMSERQQQMLMNQSRFLAEKASLLLGENDAYTARLLAIEALPKDLKHPDRPYTLEAEMALRRVTSKESFIVRDYPGPVCCAIFNQRENCIYVGDLATSNIVRIYDVDNGTLRDSLESAGEDNCELALSHDERILVSISQYGILTVWNLDTKKITYKSDSIDGSCCSFSSDGKLLAIGNSKGEILLFSIPSVQIAKRIKICDEYLYSVKFDSKGEKLLCLNGNEMILVDIKTGKTENRKIHDDLLISLDINKDDSYIVTTSWNGTVKLWDAKNLKVVRQFVGHSKAVLGASFSPDNNSILSYSDDKSIRIWDVKSGKEKMKLLGHSIRIMHAFYNKTGDKIVSCSFDKTMRVWDLKNRIKSKSLKGHMADVNDVAYAPNGKYIVSASKDGTIKIWNSKSGSLFKTLTGHHSEVTSVSFSPDGKLLLSTSLDKTMMIWDANSLKLLHTIKNSKSGLTHSRFSNDGKRFLTISEDSLVKVWNVASRKEMCSIDVNSLATTRDANGAISPVWAASFTPDDSIVLVPWANQFVAFWDSRTGAFCENYALSVSYAAKTSMIFSNDNKLLAVGYSDGSITIFSGENYDFKKNFNCHEDGYIRTCAFSPDNKYIVTGSDDNTVKLWDVENGKLVYTMEGHLKDVTSVAFSPLGNQIVSSSLDGTIRIWDFPPLQELIDQTRERFKNRKLSEDERRKYYLE